MVSRRGVLLGAAGLLGGCSTLDDLVSGRPAPLPGVRQAVLSSPPEATPDPGLAARPVTLPPPVAVSDWPQPGGSAAHAPGHVALPGDLREVWRAGVGGGGGLFGGAGRITAGPVVSGGVVFVVDAFGSASAFSLDRGTRLWSFDTRPEDEPTGALGGGCAADGGTLYVATGMGEVLALDPATGAPRWRVRVGAPARGAPAVAGGRVFVVTLENRLVALSAEEGRQLWVHRASPVTAMSLGLATPAVEGEIVVAGFPSGELAALRAPEGRLLWTETVAGAARGTIADIGGIRAAPGIRDGVVHVAGLSGLAIAVDLRSGRRLWEREASTGSTPAVAGDWAFLVAEPSRLLCVERQTGRIRWVADPAGGGRGAVRAAPLLAGGRLIVPGTDSLALLLDPADGTLAGTLRLPGPVLQPMAVAGGRLVMLTEDGTLVAYAG
ncbi:MAG: PQQ-binding-like beta-propeller repeat protein [Acetobacteraceae bacterium]|nr:PQQ-binding-like beta-propeller repeat protein [Acetobacteraceae bacterium]MDW8397626.1 PQQ-binding-like beta-propeller repeat protein [Acetobacteraceae bacterium]